MSDNSFSAITLEKFIPNSFNLTYDCFVGPCLGFKHLGIIHNYNFVEDSTIILYSDSDAQLNWSKFLYEEWSGNLYQLWGMLQDYLNDTKTDLIFPPIMENKQINSVYLDQIYSEYGIDMDLLMEQWHRIKKFKWLFSKGTDTLVQQINHDCYKGLYLYDPENKLTNITSEINAPVVLENKDTVSLITQKSGA